MAEFHFVEDYERIVSQLIENHPIDEAMSLAVGGSYGSFGKIELELLKHLGLRDGMSVFDLGCGSGRLASAIGASGLSVAYTGTDIVQSLLDYAASKTPSHYRFILHRDLSIPMPDSSVDLVCAFSVFTHLLHEESFIYLEEMRRILKPGGSVTFSFLEFATPAHWAVFEQTVEARRATIKVQLNQFIERNEIEIWAKHLDFSVERFVDGGFNSGSGALGQSVAVLRVSG